MSGGYWDYRNDRIFNDLDGMLKELNTNHEFSEHITYIQDLANLLHAYDWYMSGDTSEEEYLQEKDKFFKKWMINNPKIYKEKAIIKMNKIRKKLNELDSILKE